MTSSKLNSWLVRAVALLVLLVAGTRTAGADRKRLVVLDFEGDEAEAIQKSFTKFLKKSHTVLKTEKWTSAAEELSATKINEKNVKKVAKKVKVDGIITGNVEKRRDEFIIRIKVRSGSTGALVGTQVNLKTDEPKLSKEAKGDIETELFPQIDGLESVRGEGGDSEEEEKEEEKEEKGGSKFGGKQMKEDEPKLSKKDEEKKKKEEEKLKKEEEEKAKKDEEKKKKEDAAAKKDEEKKRKEEEKAALASKKDKKEESKKEEEEEESPLPKKKDEKKKKTAKREETEEEEGVEEVEEPRGKVSRAVALSQGQRAVDAVVGLSLNMRRLAFTYDSTIGTRPAGYKGKPVPGGFIDMTVYPMALGHSTTKGQLKNIGATFFYDQVLLVKSQDMTGKELKSAQSRFGVGLVYRYPFGESASSPVIGARVRYGRQAFKITQPAPLPNVNYTVIDPGIFFRLPLGKISLDANLGYLAIPNTGQMQNMDKYGAATVGGFELGLGADYNLTQEIFLRGTFDYETIRYSFKGAGQLTENGKVKGAADSYYGGYVTAGYLF
jgi:hypothetical protein